MSADYLLKCEPERLLAPLAQVVARSFRVARTDDGNAFLELMYVAETVVKWHATVLESVVHDVERDEANHIGAVLARANSLGDWSRSIDMALAVSRRNARVEALSRHRYWLESTKPGASGAQMGNALAATNDILTILGEASLRYSKNVLGLLRVLVAVRNATRAHGALTASVYRQLNPRLALVLDHLLESDITQQGQLFAALDSPLGDETTCLLLVGSAPRRRIRVQLPALAGSALWYRYSQGSSIHVVAPFLQFDADTLAFYVANGAIDAEGNAPFLNYATGKRAPYSLNAFVGIPAERPPSTTAGGTTLQLSDRVGHNLPEAPIDYVERPSLESEVRRFLTDRRNRLVTLHGPGGAGKTSLALATIHKLLDEERDLPFDFVIWCSARDVDLLEGAPRLTRREVSDLQSIALLFAHVTEWSVSEHQAIRVLASALESEDPRYLLVLDNFETVDNPAAVFSFFNDHTTLPNRTLITAREHDFSGDQVVPVVRMELQESEQLVSHEAAIRGIKRHLDSDVVRRIHEACAGNPYAMKLVVAQLASTRNLEEVLRVTFGRSDLQQALCQRAFAELDDWAGYLFLLLGQLRFDPLDSMLHIPAARRGFRFEEARASLLQRALAEAEVTASGERTLTISELHQAFARQQIVGDLREPIVIEDAKFLSQYRPTRDPKTSSLFRRLGDDMLIARRDGQMEKYLELRAGLEVVAVAEPQFFVEQADYLIRAGDDPELVRAAFKTSLEWREDDPNVWRAWAAYERAQNDRFAELHVLASWASRCPDDVVLNQELAAQIADAFNSVKQTIPADQRIPYLRPCRDNLERFRAELDGTGLSRLAWLYLLEGDEMRSQSIVEQGLRDFPDNPYLLNLQQKLAR